jgi:hypothetical protein
MATAAEQWYYLRGLKEQGAGASGDGFSAAATAAFANYDTLGDGLTDAEKTAMAAYIDQEVIDGNHATKDYETIYSLSGTNALVDYIGGKVATLSVTPPIQGASGFDFVGTTQYIDSNYNPTTDGTKYLVNDAHAEVFIVTNNNANRGFFYSTDSLLSIKTNAGANYRYYLNSTNLSAGTSGGLTANRLTAIARSGATSVVNIINGVSTANTEASTALANGNIRIGRDASSYINGTIATFMAGGVSADNAAHYTNLVTLLGAI